MQGRPNAARLLEQHQRLARRGVASTKALPAGMPLAYPRGAARAQGSSLEEDRDSLEYYRGSRKAYQDEISPKFAIRFVEGIRKLIGSTLGDRRKKTGRLTARMSEAAELAG
ncbi:hypothetical protein BHM03_00019117, partial [Ensete ventricosum]